MTSVSLKLTSVVPGDLKERPGKFQDYLTGVLCVIGNCIGSVLEEAMMQRQTEEKFRLWMEKLIRLDIGEENKQPLEPRELKLHLVGQRISPSPNQVLTCRCLIPRKGHSSPLVLT